MELIDYLLLINLFSSLVNTSRTINVPIPAKTSISVWTPKKFLAKAIKIINSQHNILTMPFLFLIAIDPNISVDVVACPLGKENL